MAQILQPLFILILLIFTLLYHQIGVTSLEYADYKTLMDIKNSASKDYLAEIWKTNLKETVKATAPEILRS